MQDRVVTSGYYSTLQKRSHFPQGVWFVQRFLSKSLKLFWNINVRYLLIFWRVPKRWSSVFAIWINGGVLFGYKSDSILKAYIATIVTRYPCTPNLTALRNHLSFTGTFNFVFVDQSRTFFSSPKRETPFNFTVLQNW